MDDRYHNAMMARRAMARRVPGEFMLVNYLENPDGAYINTLYKHHSGTRYIVNVRNSLYSTTGGRLLGFGNTGYTGTKLAMFFKMANATTTTQHTASFWLGEAVGSTVTIRTGGKNGRFTVELDATNGAPRGYVDGAEVVSGTNSYAYNYNVNLFCTHPSASTDSFFLDRMYWCRMIYRGSLARDFVPVVRLSDGKPGLYDLCGSTSNLTNSPFYISANTKEFTWG